MMTLKQLLLGSAVAVQVLAASPAVAQLQLSPTPVTGDARMVTFEYDEDRTYKVLIRPRNTTQLKFAQDERVTYVSAGDTANFMISVPAAKTFVEVKPKHENMTTNMLVVTTKRSYHIDLQSTGEGKKWYTRVAWAYQDNAIVDLTAEHDRALDSGLARPARAAVEPVEDRDASAGIRPEALSFDYVVEGDAPFRPLQVFDDGARTFIRLPDDVQELPALFMRTSESDEVALVNYSVTDNHMVAQRLMDRFLLKIGKAEVRISKAKPRKWRWPVSRDMADGF